MREESVASNQPDAIIVDKVQVFDAGEALRGAASPDGRVEMAVSPNCYILEHRVASPGQIQMPVEQNADTIVLVLQGAASVAGPSGTHALNAQQGLLIPSGVSCTFTSTGAEELALLSFRSDSAESRPGYLPNVPSGVIVRVPAAEIASQGIGGRVYLFALDHRTLRVAVGAKLEWNEAAFLRMNCLFERDGDDLLVNLPERMVRWYGIRDLTEGDYRVIPQPERTSVLLDLTPLVEREAEAFLASQADR
jgi:hypothetical protein